MSTAENTTLLYYPKADPRRRLFALWYFTPLLILWTVLGQTYLGFEQALLLPVLAVLTGVFLQILFEWIDALVNDRPVRFADSFTGFLNFLPPGIIPGLACSMLLYPNERIWPVLFAVALSITSKVLFRAPVGNGRTQHIFNPSNIGIAATLLLFPSVGFAPPYHFTANLVGAWHWILPGVVLLSGIVIHALFTGRLPLCLAWVLGFACQALFRSWYFDGSWFAPLVPMTSAAFIVFTLYMIPDPATTPIKTSRQIAFGVAVAIAYGVLQVLHVVFGLFFALCLVSACRGIVLYIVAAFASQPDAETVAPDSSPSTNGQVVVESGKNGALAPETIDVVVSGSGRQGGA